MNDIVATVCKKAAVLVVACWALGSSAAYAQAPTEVESLASRAQLAYKGARYGDAVALYLKAYRLQPASILLYNIGYIYDRKLDEPSLAVTYYRRYIKAIDAEPDLVQKATRRLRTLKESVAVAPGQRPPAAGVDTPNMVRRNAIRSTGPPAASVRRQAGFGLLGAGGAVLATGVVLGVLAQQEQQTFATSVSYTERVEARDLGQKYALAGDVLMAVGAITSVTGLILALTAPAERTVGVSAAPVSGGAVFVMTGSL